MFICLLQNTNTAKQKILYQNMKNISFSLSLSIYTDSRWDSGPLALVIGKSPIHLQRQLRRLLQEISSNFKHKRTWPTDSLQLTSESWQRNRKWPTGPLVTWIKLQFQAQQDLAHLFTSTHHQGVFAEWQELAHSSFYIDRWKPVK